MRQLKSSKCCNPTQEYHPCSQQNAKNRLPKYLNCSKILISSGALALSKLFLTQIYLFSFHYKTIEVVNNISRDDMLLEAPCLPVSALLCPFPWRYCVSTTVGVTKCVQCDCVCATGNCSPWLRALRPRVVVSAKSHVTP
jgi:hypothetical protein